jgi:hypothetical protein
VKAPALPEAVKIGYRTFRIEDWEPGAAATKARFGECDTNAGVIRISRMFGAAKAANTLLHEILHGCYAVFCIDAEDDEEQTVSAVANALSTVWRDNPDVLNWIGRQLLRGG